MQCITSHRREELRVLDVSFYESRFYHDPAGSFRWFLECSALSMHESKG